MLSQIKSKLAENGNAVHHLRDANPDPKTAQNLVARFVFLLDNSPTIIGRS